MIKQLRYSGLFILSVLLSFCLQQQSLPFFASSGNPSVFAPTSKPIPASLFNLNLINLDYGASWPSIPFRIWRNFYADWPLLEPRQGEWNFATLDRDMALAEQQGVEVMLILKETPTWASARPEEPGCCYPNPPNGAVAEAKNIEDWKNYVRTVATRYRGRVRYYELWNEPNVPRFYSGTIEQLVRLNQAAYQVLKQVDPNITVVSSGLSPYGEHLRYFERYLALGGGQAADVIGYHFYVAPHAPEAMLPVIRHVQALMAKYQVADKPLWNTEMGWRMENSDQNIEDETWAGRPLNSRDAVAYLARSYILNWAAGVEQVYWYAWGHRSMGLTDYNLKRPKAVARAYTELQRWLVGSTLKQCETRQRAWICQLQRSDGSMAWMVWNPNRNQRLELPPEWGVRQMQELSGKRHSLVGRNHVKMHPTPLLLESQPT
uniref:Glycoside hydrolase family 5 domain-containing protein n=2 Tax=Desertifilaceae TaxID=1969992 RepID=A0A1E5QIT1_9CYAN|nr:hypothetical protein BH720_13880 [Desertifilum tharense IPPAS B-1220]